MMLLVSNRCLQWSDEVVRYGAFGTAAEQEQALWSVQAVFDLVEQFADRLPTVDGTVVGDDGRPWGVWLLRLRLCRSGSSTLACRNFTYS
jgi:hypothetical protein